MPTGLFTFNEKASQDITDTHTPILHPIIHKSRREIVSFVPLQKVLFPMNIIPGAERIPCWGRGPCLKPGPHRDGEPGGRGEVGMLAQNTRTNQDPRRSRG